MTVAIIDEVLATVDYLRITVGDTSDRWVRCAPLLASPAALGAVIGPTKPHWRTDRDDVATSLFVQGYAFRIASVSIGAWVVSDAVLDVSPDNVSIALGRGGPNAVDLAMVSEPPPARAGAPARAPAPVEALHAALIDGHLAALVDTAHRSCRVGEALLWGNVAASCATAFAAFAAALPDRRVELGDRAERFFATARAEVGDRGCLVRIGSHVAWERRSCCLWYRTDSGYLCDSCSLRSDADREARCAAMVVDGVGA